MPRTEAERQAFAEAEKKFNNDMLPLDRYFERFAGPAEKHDYLRCRTDFMASIKKALQAPGPQARALALKEADGFYLPQINEMHKNLRKKNLNTYIYNLETKNLEVEANITRALGPQAAAEVRPLQVKLARDLKNIADNDIANTERINNLKSVFVKNLRAVLDKYSKNAALTEAQKDALLAPYNTPRPRSAAANAVSAQKPRLFLDTDPQARPRPARPAVQVFEKGVAVNAAEAAPSSANPFNNILGLAQLYPGSAQNMIYISKDKMPAVETNLQQYLRLTQSSVEGSLGPQAAARYVNVFEANKKSFVNFITAPRPAKEFEDGFIQQTLLFDRAREHFLLDETRKQLLSDIAAHSASINKAVPDAAKNIDSIKLHYTSLINKATDDLIAAPAREPGTKMGLYHNAVHPIVNNFQTDCNKTLLSYNAALKDRQSAQISKDFDSNLAHSAAEVRREFGPGAEQEYRALMAQFKGEYTNLVNAKSDVEMQAKEKILNAKINSARENFILQKSKTQLINNAGAQFAAAAPYLSAQEIQTLRAQFNSEVETSARNAAQLRPGQRLLAFSKFAADTTEKYQHLVNQRAQAAMQKQPAPVNGATVK